MSAFANTSANRVEKEKIVAELKAELADKELLVITRNDGLSVKQATELRAKVRKEGGTYGVYKNTLVRRALAGTKFEGLSPLFTGPTAIAASKDPISAARIIHDFAKGNEKLVILGGANTEGPLPMDKIKFLATLPSLDALRGKIVGLLQAPGAQLARVVNAYATKDQQASS